MGFLKILKEKCKNKENNTKKLSPHFAAIQGNLLVRADRICRRMRKFSDVILKDDNTEVISKKEFVKVINTLEMVIYQELNIRGKEGWKNGANNIEG